MNSVTDSTVVSTVLVVPIVRTTTLFRLLPIYKLVILKARTKKISPEKAACQRKLTQFYLSLQHDKYFGNANISKVLTINVLYAPPNEAQGPLSLSKLLVDGQEAAWPRGLHIFDRLQLASDRVVVVAMLKSIGVDHYRRLRRTATTGKATSHLASLMSHE